MKALNQNYLKAALALLSMIFMVYIGTALFRGEKLDLTEEKLYTLSKGTKSILEKLNSPVRLKLYYSKTAANKGTEGLREFNNHFLYVRDLLEEFAARSRNNITLELVDPRPDTEEEEDALASGLKKFHLTETERYFFGLVAIGESGSEKIIEFFNPGEKANLEYDLAKLIYSVIDPQKKTIGVISSLPVLNEDLSPTMRQLMAMQGRPSQSSWLSLQMLKELYHIKKVESDAESIPAVDVLAVIHPKGFPEKTLFAIDQYLMKGGKLLVLADPHAISAGQQSMNGESSASPDQGFAKLMQAWGVEVPKNTFAGDKFLSGVGRFGSGAAPGRMLPLMACDQRCVDGYQNPISAGLGDTTFVFPGVVKVKTVEGIEHRPILSTTKKGNTYEGTGHELRNPAGLWRKFKEGEEQVTLGQKAVGKFKSAYPEGLNKKDKDFLSSATKEGAVVVFSDVDFISDQFAFKNTFLGPALANDNTSLFMNSIEALAGNTDLMSVRSKGRFNRGFDVVDAIEFEAEKKTADKVREINASISRFQRELNELGSKATSGNLTLLRNEGVKKKKELAKKIALLKKELRFVKRKGREKVEDLGSFFHYFNTLFSPALTVAFGVYYSRRRKRALNKQQGEESSKENIKKFKEAQA